MQEQLLSQSIVLHPLQQLGRVSHYSLPYFHLLLVYSSRILQISKQSIAFQAICHDSQLTPSLSPYLLLINKQIQYKINCFPRPTLCFFPAATRSSHNQFLFNQVTNQQYHLAACFDYSLQKMAIPRKYVFCFCLILLTSSQAGYKLNLYKYYKLIAMYKYYKCMSINYQSKRITHH